MRTTYAPCIKNKLILKPIKLMFHCSLKHKNCSM